MKRLAAVLIAGFACVTVWTGSAMAQGRSANDWMTDNGDAQRSAWVRADAKINKDSMQKPGFQFLWKVKVKNAPRQLNSLMPPATLERLIGYRGFRMLGFFGGSSDTIFTLDTDLGRMEWERRLTSNAPGQTGTLACPGGMTTSVVRPTTAFIPPSPTGTGGGGRSTPAKSGVGEPGKGAVTLAMVRPNPPVSNPAVSNPAVSNPAVSNPAAPPASPAASAPPSPPARPNPANPAGGQFGAGPFLVYALSGDGMLHSLHLSNGADFEPPVKFLPPNANASGLIVIDQIAYVVTSGNCGGAVNGVWALDLATKQITSWKGNVVGTAGHAFGADGTVYIATGSGGDTPNSLVALDPKTLAVKGIYSAGNQEFSSTPVLFLHKGKTLIAVTTKDGRMHLLDAEKLAASGSIGGCDVCLIFSTPAPAKAGEFSTGALASWQDTSGTRWILAPTNNAVVALKIVEQNGTPSLQPGWASRELVSPLTPTIVNGVVFAVSSGEFRSSDSRVTAAQRAQRSSPAVVYALDATTGKELWSSGTTITSFAHGGAISGGMGQIYLTTHDGTIYAFGFPMEH